MDQGTQVKVHSNLLAVLLKNLEQSHYDLARCEIVKNEHQAYIAENSMDVVQALMMVVEEAFFSGDAEVCLEDLLLHVAKVAMPKEVIIALLEEFQIKRSEASQKICIKCLKVVLVQSKGVNGRSAFFRDVANSILDYIKSVDLPVDYDCDYDRNLADADANSVRLTAILDVTVELYEQLCQEVNCGRIEWLQVRNQKLFLLQYVMDLFEDPLLYLQVFEGSCSWRACQKLLNIVDVMAGNVSCLVKYIRAFGVSNRAKENLNDDLTYVNTITFNTKSIASYLHCALVVGGEEMPCVYTKEYMYVSCLPCAVSLLAERRCLVEQKGLQLLDWLIAPLADSALDHRVLELPNQMDLYQQLLRILIYSQQLSHRQHALQIYEKLLAKWNVSARLQLFYILLSCNQHPNIVAHITDNFRKCLHQPLSSAPKDVKMMQKVTEKCCRLPAGETTDLFEYSEQIMSALSLLTILTSWKGVWNLFPIVGLKETFVDPLANAVRWSRAHYQLKLKQLQENATAPVGQAEVNGQPLAPPTRAQQINTLHISLNHIELVANSHARVQALFNNL